MRSSVVFFAVSLAAAAPNTHTPLFDRLSGTFDEFDAFVTAGGCAASPDNSEDFWCNPAKLGTLKRSRFEATGLVSATDSALTIADTLRKNELGPNEVNNLFSKYNYSEMLLSTRLSFVMPSFLMGVRPVRYQGQFQSHYPDAPLASLSYRDDTTLFLGAGNSFGVESFRVSVGWIGQILFRQEYLSEAKLSEFNAKPMDQLLWSRKSWGYFTDLGTELSTYRLFKASVYLQNLGELPKAGDVSDRYLYVLHDKAPRVLTALSLIPGLGQKSEWGIFQVGPSYIYFLQKENYWNEQWFATVSYYVGPLKILSSFRPDFLRTGLSVDYSNYRVSVAQEWINRLEAGRSVQPRFTLEVAAGL